MKCPIVVDAIDLTQCYGRYGELIQWNVCRLNAQSGRIAFVASPEGGDQNVGRNKATTCHQNPNRSIWLQLIGEELLLLIQNILPSKGISLFVHDKFKTMYAAHIGEFMANFFKGPKQNRFHIVRLGIVVKPETDQSEINIFCGYNSNM